TLHYIDYEYLSLDGFSKRKVYFPTEFLHGLYDGGHGAGLDDYWGKMWIDPLCAGGYLWVFADEAIERTDKNRELDTDGNHAPDGILGPYNEKEGSFYTIKEIWAPVFFEKKYIIPGFDGTFRIENRYHFTNLNQCSFKAEWVKFSNPGKELRERILKKEDLTIDLAPEQKGILKVSLPDNWQQFDAIRITAIDPYGRHLNNWSWPLKKAAAKASQLLIGKKNTTPLLEETMNKLIVKSGIVTMIFDKMNGTIVSIKKGERLIHLTNGPVFVSKEKKVKELKHFFKDDDLIIQVFFEKGDFFKWTITKEGIVDLDVAYKPANDCKFAGISFNYPEEQVKGMKWLGDGPYRVYKNRMKGVNFGLWEKEYNNTITGESGFEYPEFKGYHSEMYWVEILGNDVPDFKIYVHNDDIFLRMLTPDDPKAPKDTKIEYPKGDISFLHGINAIGTKFKNTDTTGPQASPYKFNAQKIHGEKLRLKLSFDFN
ncbi:MAG: beta-galactosidase, partial [Maribacter sp.]